MATKAEDEVCRGKVREAAEQAALVAKATMMIEGGGTRARDAELDWVRDDL